MYNFNYNVLCCEALMISSLTLSNFALFKTQTIDFNKGFNCLLGQSGAGKSIVIDALAFVLGAKSDRSFLRSGESLMRVDGVFSSLSEDCLSLLREWEIDCDDEIIISRTLSKDGKSSLKVNGCPITLKMLQNLTSKMADFCGQHDSVGLLDSSKHLLLLDKYAGVELFDAKCKVEQLYTKLKDVKAQISSLGGDESERARESDLLAFQVGEIEDAQLQPNEDIELKERFDFISSSEKIYEKLGAVIEKLAEQRDNAVSILYDSKSTLSGLANFSDIEECQTRLENVYYEVKDIAEVLEKIKESADFDPKELERIDSRLDLIKKLSKKYGKTIEEILNYQARCQERLEKLASTEELLSKYQAEEETLKLELKEKCEELTSLRMKYAKELEQKIMKQLDDLDMKGTLFKVEFSKCECFAKGQDSVKFMFSANKGQEIKDLHKIASGGELSRILLAFKNVMLDKELVQTVVFDEIDSGISGVTAGRVADKLSNISKFIQTICITHTPVVASKADAFVLITKSVENEQTVSHATTLSRDEAVVEIAKLIDGDVNPSQTALNHAKKLIEN